VKLAYRRARFGCVLLAFAAFAGPTVSKVEPPNWWPGHTMNPVRVLISGTGLTGATVKAAQLNTSNTRVNAAGTYLMVDVEIPRGARAGSYPLEIQTSSGNTRADFRLETPLDPAGRFQGFSADDVIYLIMPDRFANGDAANDDPAISPGMFNRKKSRYYHGGDLQGIMDHLPYLKSLGVTAIWMTPVYDNTNTLNRQQAVNGEAIADYHGYGATDYYGVEEHFGTLALLRKLVDAAHREGMKVIQDQVANHTGPGHPWVSDPPKPTWFHGTPAQHINETWQIWSLTDRGASPKLQRDVLDGWFVNLLPDMNQEDADVARYEIQNALWWVGTTGFDGIRQDTLPYVPVAFWKEWSAALHKQYPKLRVVGEVFDGDPAVPSFFQGTAVDTVFDFPTYFNVREIFGRGGSLESAAKTLAKDRYYADANSLVTFLGLHDVARFMSEPGATAAKLKLAFTYLLTVRGTPMIYYGDEIGMAGGDDPDNRRDFPGGWKGDRRNAFEETGRTAQEQEIFHHVQRLLALRGRTAALRHGRFVDIAVTEKTWTYARVGETNTAIVVVNNGDQAAEVEVPYEDGVYTGQLGVGGELRVSGGRGVARVGAHEAEVYVR
jgi:glycosidase